MLLCRVDILFEIAEGGLFLLIEIEKCEMAVGMRCKKGGKPDCLDRCRRKVCRAQHTFKFIHVQSP